MSVRPCIIKTSIVAECLAETERVTLWSQRSHGIDYTMGGQKDTTIARLEYKERSIIEMAARRLKEDV